MRRMIIALAGALALTACSDAAADRDYSDCQGRVSYQTGSIPPPYNYGWLLTLDGEGSATYEFHANYVDDGEIYHAEGIPVTPEQANALCGAFAKAPTKRTNDTGGGMTAWEFGDIVGRDEVLVDGVPALDAILDIVGHHHSDAKKAFEEWQETYTY